MGGGQCEREGGGKRDRQTQWRWERYGERDRERSPTRDHRDPAQRYCQKEDLPLCQLYLFTVNQTKQHNVAQCEILASVLMFWKPRRNVSVVIRVCSGCSFYTEMIQLFDCLPCRLHAGQTMTPHSVFVPFTQNCEAALRHSIPERERRSEGERETERDGEREGEKERERDRGGERENEKEREKKEREGERGGEREKTIIIIGTQNTHTCTNKHTLSFTHSNTQTYKHTLFHSQPEPEPGWYSGKTLVATNKMAAPQSQGGLRQEVCVPDRKCVSRTGEVTRAGTSCSG